MKSLLKIYRKLRLQKKSWLEHPHGVTWRDSKFKWGDKNPMHISAKDYYDFKQMGTFLENRIFSNALDFGCGYGRRTGYISEYSKNISGVDISEQALTAARLNFPKIDFGLSDGQILPYKDNYFDLVVTFVVLQHIPPKSIQKVCDEILRVLHLGGNSRLLITEAIGVKSAEWRYERTLEEYQKLFEPLFLERHEPRAYPLSKSGVNMLMFKQR